MRGVRNQVAQKISTRPFPNGAEKSAHKQIGSGSTDPGGVGLDHTKSSEQQALRALQAQPQVGQFASIEPEESERNQQRKQVDRYGQRSD